MRGALTVLAVAAVALSGLPFPANSLPLGGLYGGTVTVAVLSDVNPDPMTADAADLEVLALAYDSLAKRDPESLTPEPWLALNWTLTPNTATFAIRTDAKWWDGAAVTPADVAWSHQRYNKAGVSVLAGTDSVTFTFTSNAGRFFGEWIYLPIAWKSSQSGLPTIPGGNGPYLIRENVVGDHLTLEANDGHWYRRPYLDAVVFKRYSNETNAACGLINREATMWGFPAQPSDPAESRLCPTERTLLNTSFLAVVRNPGLTQLYVALNTQSPRGPLDEPALRRGIIQTLDKDIYLNIAGAAYHEIAESLVVAGNFHWYNASVPRYRVDKVIVGTTAVANFDRVNNELDLAGYLDRDSDGWRDDRGGSPFTLDLHVPSVATDIQKFTIAQIMDQNLGKIGIRHRLVQATWAEIDTVVASNAFDIAFGLYDAGKDPDFYYDLFHSSRIATGSNFVDLDDPAANAAMAATRNEIDPDVRRQLAKDMQGWIAENVPLNPILHQKAVDIYEKETYTGWVNSVGGVNNFWTFMELHVFPQGDLSVALSFSKVRMESGDEADVVVVVTDQDGNGVGGAEVELTGTGTFVPANGTANSNGRFEAKFTAGAVTATTDVEITASAALSGYTSASRTAAVTVVPERRTLRVTIERPVSFARIASGSTAVLNITVLDTATLAPVVGASVALSVTPSNFGAAVTPASGLTAANGKLQVTFTGDVSVETYFQVVARVTVPGYEEPGPAQSTIIVERHLGSFGETPNTPGPDSVTLVALVGVLAFAYVRLQERRRKRT